MLWGLKDLRSFECVVCETCLYLSANLTWHLFYWLQEEANKTTGENEEKSASDIGMGKTATEGESEGHV